MIDLWPEDFASVGERSPISILKEQAAYLGKRTKNLVEGKVSKTGQSILDLLS